MTISHGGASIIDKAGGGPSGVTNIATTTPITGGPITSTGTIGITKADTTHDGYLAQGDFSTFNSKVSSQWTESGGNLSSPTGDTVVVGSSTTSLDTFTVQTGSTGGEFINSTATANGIDSNAVVVLHAANNITDSSLSPNTFTNNGSVAFTSGTGFGAGYAFTFNGGGTKSLTTPANAAFDLGSGNWTVDFRIKWNTHTSSGIFLSDSTDDNNYVGWFWSSGASGFNYQVVSGGSVTQRFHAAFTPTNGTWYHIAFVRSSSSGLIFVNGVSQTVTIDNALGTVAHYTGTLNVGFNSVIGNDPDALIQELRFSPGIARWTSNFTPPASPYSSSAGNPHTILGVNGTQTAKIWTDGNNGNQLTGTIGASTDFVKVPTTGITTFPLGLVGLGTTTNDSAATGYIGEYVSASLASGSATSLTTGTAKTITSISLTAGDWDVTGVVDFHPDTTTTTTYLQGGISTTNNTLGAADTYFSNTFAIATTSVDASEVCPTVRISINTTTTVYLVAVAGFAISTLSGYGTIRARRVR